MTVDTPGRTRFFEDRKTKTLVNGMKDAIVQAVDRINTGKSSNEDILKLVVKHENDEKEFSMLEKIGKALVLIYKAIPKSVVLPKIFPIKGSVEADIRSIPPVKVANWKELQGDFRSLSEQMGNIARAISSVPSTKIQVPKIEVPKIDNKDLLRALQELKTVIKESGKKIDETDGWYRVEQAVLALVNKPTMTTAPVTNVNINGLQGFAKTTQVTVGTTLTEIPPYGQLFNRRSMIIFNNSASVTVYIGGSDLLSGNGLPVLAQTYSPSIDAGYNMQIYALTSSSTADIRVMEVSKDQTANVQE